MICRLTQSTQALGCPKASLLNNAPQAHIFMRRSSLPLRSVCWKACIVFRHIPTVEITTNIMLGKSCCLVCKKLIQPNVRHPFCRRRGVRLFDQVPKVFLVPGPPSQVSRCAIWIFSFVHQRMKKSSLFQQGVKAHSWFAEPPNAKVLDVVQDQLARLYIKNIK